MLLQLKQTWNFDGYQDFIREFKLEKWFKNTFGEEYDEFDRIDIGDDEIFDLAFLESNMFKDRKMFSIYNEMTDSFDVYEFEKELIIEIKDKIDNTIYYTGSVESPFYCELIDTWIKDSGEHAIKYFKDKPYCSKKYFKDIEEFFKVTINKLFEI